MLSRPHYCCIRCCLRCHRRVSCRSVDPRTGIFTFVDRDAGQSYIFYNTHIVGDGLKNQFFDIHTHVLCLHKINEYFSFSRRSTTTQYLCVLYYIGQYIIVGI